MNNKNVVINVLNKLSWYGNSFKSRLVKFLRLFLKYCKLDRTTDVEMMAYVLQEAIKTKATH